MEYDRRWIPGFPIRKHFLKPNPIRLSCLWIRNNQDDRNVALDPIFKAARITGIPKLLLPTWFASLAVQREPIFRTVASIRLTPFSPAIPDVEIVLERTLVFLCRLCAILPFNSKTPGQKRRTNSSLFIPASQVRIWRKSGERRMTVWRRPGIRTLDRGLALIHLCVAGLGSPE